MPRRTAQLRMDMKSPQVPRADSLVGYAFLSRKEVSLLRRLIHNRRSLPVYRAGGWLCYECAFAATDLAVMVRHIVRAHTAVGANPDDADEDDRHKRRTRRSAGPSSAHRFSPRGGGPVNGRANPSYRQGTARTNRDGPRQPVMEPGKRAAP